MGIPRFVGDWLKPRNYPGVVLTQRPAQVSSLAIDLNGTIHRVAGTVYAYGQKVDPAVANLIAQADPAQLEVRFQDALGEQLFAIIRQIQPQDHLILAVDGVAPVAKIQQQRQRRYKSAALRPQQQVFDSNCITPGTEFMIRLDNFLQRWIASNRLHLPTHIHYSSHLVPGEGEHKIAEVYRSSEIDPNQPGAHVLYGLDADLVMLSLLSPLPRIHLMREDVADVLSIDDLRRALASEMGTPTAIADFVVLMFLLGNDFLPHPPIAEEMGQLINRLLKAYSEVGRSLTTAQPPAQIEWANLALLVERLAEQEPQLLADAALSPRRMKAPSKLFELAMSHEGFHYGRYRDNWYLNALGARNPDYLQSLLGPGYLYSISEADIVDMCVSYARGMAWTLLYYQGGMATINHDYYYPYHHSPMLVDLSVVLAGLNEMGGYQAQPDVQFFSPLLEQLVSVLPSLSIALVPIELRALYGLNSVIADLFPDGFVLEVDGREGPEHGVAIVPFATPNRVREALSHIVISEARLAMWDAVAPHRLSLTPEEQDAIKRKRALQAQRAGFQPQSPFKATRMTPANRPTFSKPAVPPAKPAGLAPPAKLAGVVPKQTGLAPPTKLAGLTPPVKPALAPVKSETPQEQWAKMANLM